MTPLRRIALVSALAVTVGLFAVPTAWAADASATSAASGSTNATSGYDMSLTLPSYGKSGCMVCHGDPNLVRIKNHKLVSFAMDQKRIDASAHKNVACTACHTDFAFSAPHKARASWQEAAKSSCRTCHQKEWDAMARSVHGAAPAPGEKSSGKPQPLCGDCHGGHYIGLATKDPVARAALHASADKMCGRCHEDYAANYNDYYHGAAYNKGASDAPACWQCHGAHDILPSKDPKSATNKANLAQTCSACHEGASDAYTQYATIIHRKDRALSANPVYATLRSTGQAIGGVLSNLMEQLRSVFTTGQATAAKP